MKEQLELIKISLLDNFRREMNGAVAGTMRKLKALEGYQSYGVSLPTIKTIVSHHVGNHELALYIFESKVRELKLSATIIDNPELVTLDQIKRWAENCDNKEILNSIARLAAQSKIAVELFREWISDSDLKYRRMALLLAGGALKRGIEIENIENLLIEEAKNCGAGEINEVVFALTALISCNPTIGGEIVKELSNCENIFAKEVACFF